MSDLIDRQAAIDAVQRHREGVLGGYEYDEGVAFVYAAAHNHIIDVIKQLPSAQPERSWIPCKERMPEHEVLCCDARGEMIIGYVFEDKISETGYSAETEGVYMYDCVAWMPLPEPWKGEENA